MPHRAAPPVPPPVAERQALAAHEARVAELVARLGQAHPGQAVEVLRTHISTLVLAGDEAWKLKRPVHLPFVDFSTAQARHAACVEELRLNRRTAPALYRDVVPVAAVAAVGCGDAGEPADWAVRMRRFDERQRLDRMARAGQLGEAQVDALAAVIAAFHAGLPPAPDWGAPEDQRRWARDNLAELRALAEPARQPVLERLQAWAEAEGARLAPRMQARRAAGFVREGHGDLHLANIVWHEGAPVLFDALEFNAEWRHLDTVADLAFAFMDLHAQGLPHLAWRLVSQVLQASGDYEALPLLAWHAVYRALVRAKVAALSPPAPAPDAPRVEYIDFAMRLAGLDAPLPRVPRLVLTCGLSGSGKSTVAAWLAEHLGTVRVRSDVERKRLFGLAATARDDPGVTQALLYGADATVRTYARLQQLAADALAEGLSMVVDAAYLRREERQAMRALAARHCADFSVVHCHAPEAELRRRLDARQAEGRDASDASAEVMLRQRGYEEAPAADERPGWIELDTGQPMGAVRAEAESLWPGPTPPPTAPGSP